LGLLDRNQGVSRARTRAHEFIERARALLAEFPESPSRRALEQATNLITNRDR
jgi:geranylgeranyl pyrophosphate synthase